MGNCCPDSKNKNGQYPPLLDKENSKKPKKKKKKREKKIIDIQILLLGAGESGKSTFLKQMRLIENGGYEEETLKQYILCIRKMCLSQIKVLIKNSEILGIPLENEDVANEVSVFKKRQPWTEPFGKKLSLLWKDIGIQKTYQYKNKKFHLFDSVSYFFDSIKRISQTEYIPNEEDVLRCRVTTIGLEEASIHFEKYKLTLIDVGGQRSERKKWSHTFEGTNSVIFFVSLIGYNQVLLENKQINRMKESLNLFSEICKSPWFAETSIILFLNKQDLFTEEIKHTSIKTAFPEFKGGKDYDKSIEFIQSKFVEVSKSMNKSKIQEIFPYVTCAIDTEMIKYITKVALDTLFQKDLKTIGLI
ncbi:guanine nucleotide-binding protein alpha-4 subunit-related [Anaeramoeba flamelloides]|uniref:Guanine nucleotide-binding protein alpha-4 subunit-related n=1 Tax=Anaeramoeba flamelloides TaxID=1746091 RepID=A0AAV7YVK7_9EUKA|nr:guanine nucleotide-binding protein alpha-4 subunit-related [Anaeramoeba flamelloides]